MNPDLLLMALAVGVATYAFRFGPTKLSLHDLPPTSRRARFLAATGPAAIATLFIASSLPVLQGGAGQTLPLIAGTLTVLAVFFWRRSVVAATLSGAAAYGLAFWLSVPA
ncbi:MAG: AzlD domain-containing protein [Paracoccaceae bacterium]